MNKKLLIFFLTIFLFNTNIFTNETVNPIKFFKSNYNLKGQIVEDFDDGEIELFSYPGEDEDPDAWSLDSTITYENSNYSLKLDGNTWKIEYVTPVSVDSGDVWQVAAYVDNFAEIQAFGVMDSNNVLLYSLHGIEELDIEEWITVYQGNFPENQWNIFQLPIADDWFAWFDYLPVITGIIFINDRDDLPYGTVYFDMVVNISEDLPIPPEVSISYSIGETYINKKGIKSVDVQFYGNIIDPDSDEHQYYWNFGDDSTSFLQNPFHTFLVLDDHPYTVLFVAVDSTNMYGETSCKINVDNGPTTFPLIMNFVGDVMLARGYEDYIIPVHGVEYIFEETKAFLGEAADITVANLECPLTTHNQHHPTKTIYFKGDPDNVDGLVYAGIDVVSIANNHILDYMLPGLQETQSVLANEGIIYSGAGENSYEAYLPAFYAKSGINIAFLASSDRTGQYNNYQPYLNAGYNKPGFAYMTPYYISKQIDYVKDISDLIVVEMHAGSEYSLVPGSGYDKSFIEENFGEDEGYFPLIDIPHMWDRQIRHYTIDSGADLVICHHPHIIQGLELYKNKLIAHSLGNFAFDLSYPETFPTMILNASINENGFYEYSVTPVYIDDYIPKRAEGELGLYILDYITRRSKELDTYLHVNRDSVIARVIFDTISMEVNHNIEQINIQFEQNINEWISEPLFLQREGHLSSILNIEPSSNYLYHSGRELIWFGNFEDEGCTLWNLNSGSEGYCDTTSYEGHRSLQHIRYYNSPDNIITNFEKRIICYSDTLDYTLYGYIRTNNGSNVTIQIRYYDSRNSPYHLGEEDIGIEIDGDTPWTFYYNNLSVPGNTHFFDIRLNSDCPDTGIAYSWFDNVGIIQWTNYNSLNIPQEIESPNDFYYLQFKSMENTQNADICYKETIFGEDYPPSSIEEDHANQNLVKLFSYPNPLIDYTTICFELNKNSPLLNQKAQIRIYNLKGQRIKVFDIPSLKYKTNSMQWFGKDDKNNYIGNGIYFSKLIIDGSVKAITKIIVIR